MAWVYILMHVNIIWELRKRTSTVLHSLRKVRVQLINNNNFIQIGDCVFCGMAMPAWRILYWLNSLFHNWPIEKCLDNVENLLNLSQTSYQLAIAYSAGWPMLCLPFASPISASISSSGPFLVLKCTKQIQLLTFDNQPILTLKSARVFIQLSWTNLAQHRCSSTANTNLIRWKSLLIQDKKCPDIWVHSSNLISFFTMEFLWRPEKVF